MPRCASAFAQRACSVAFCELQSKIARRALFVWAAVVPRAALIIKALSRFSGNQKLNHAMTGRTANRRWPYPPRRGSPLTRQSRIHSVCHTTTCHPHHVANRHCVLNFSPRRSLRTAQSVYPVPLGVRKPACALELIYRRHQVAPAPHIAGYRRHLDACPPRRTPRRRPPQC